MLLPTIDLLAPDAHAGLTRSATPDPLFLRVAADHLADPVHDQRGGATHPNTRGQIPAPRAAGIYALRTADYRVRLEPGVLYTWSVSVNLDAKARSRDIVASASLLRTTSDPAVEAALRNQPADSRVGLLAQAGLWYDAVAAAAETAALDRHAALDALMTQVGLSGRRDTIAKRLVASRRGRHQEGPRFRKESTSSGSRSLGPRCELPTLTLRNALP